MPVIYDCEWIKVDYFGYVLYLAYSAETDELWFYNSYMNAQILLNLSEYKTKALKMSAFAMKLTTFLMN